MHQPHLATVDDQGNIALPQEAHNADAAHNVPMKEGVWYLASESVAPFMWDTLPEPPSLTTVITENTTSEDSVTIHVDVTPSQVVRSVRMDVERVASDVVRESARQYSDSLRDTAHFGIAVTHAIRQTLSNAWTFLTQPVWVPNNKREPVQYSRGVLFVLDTVRFGGTFAGIFTALFVGLNYQSFYAIAQSYVEPLARITATSTTANVGSERRIAERLKHVPELTVAGKQQAGLIAALPQVGPPENRLIIPSLNVNVPIAIPPTDALMNEDWKKLEEDIQASLRDGVVHYPGTAKPGQAGNFFVTGHSSYFPWDPGKYKSIFARLSELSVGDEYWVYYGGDRHRYIIRTKKEIKPSDVSVLDQPIDKRHSTLMTCTPVGTTLRRLIISAEEVDPLTGETLLVGESAHESLPKVQMDALSI